tara:strand:+ start:207 stop:614 length:408 start_codon:yes stop_codon:yes gene_type:complete
MKSLMNTLVNKSVTQTKLRLAIKVCEHAIEIKMRGGKSTVKMFPRIYAYDSLDAMQTKLAKLKVELEIAEHQDAMNEYHGHLMLLEGHEKTVELQEKLDRAKELEREYHIQIQEHRSRSEELEDEVEQLKAKLSK